MEFCLIPVLLTVPLVSQHEGGKWSVSRVTSYPYNLTQTWNTGLTMIPCMELAPGHIPPITGKCIFECGTAPTCGSPITIIRSVRYGPCAYVVLAFAILVALSGNIAPHSVQTPEADYLPPSHYSFITDLNSSCRGTCPPAQRVCFGPIILPWSRGDKGDFLQLKGAIHFCHFKVKIVVPIIEMEI